MRIFNLFKSKKVLTKDERESIFNEYQNLFDSMYKDAQSNYSSNSGDAITFLAVAIRQSKEKAAASICKKQRIKNEMLDAILDEFK